ncbi:MAG: Rne/Rng family ribonuclease, partial [Deltaproteobacteria bacterium]|nr:Rne/Rng family ribonuclease [Deltaproteobacteria bacterium]
MANSLLISVAECDTRVALLEEGRLAEFFLERQSQSDPNGNIYKGRVTRVLPGLGAAFVDVGLSRPGYLFVEEVSDRYDDFFNFWLKEQKESPETPETPARRLPPAPIEDLLHEGQEIVVQVFRGPMGDKGARLTTHISLPGHFLVFIPNLAHLGVSRRIADEGERTRLKAVLEDLKTPEGGLIARTASEGQSPERLARERDYLLSLWQAIKRKKEAASPPALLHQHYEAARRVVREIFGPEIRRIVVDDAAAYEQITKYLENLSPFYKSQVELYDATEPIFSHFGLEIDWKKLLAPRVWLKSGGYLMFDTTEALTTIDVNTGKFVGRHQFQETILKTNLEAAREVARQLRLRNIGGLIVIDFIDLEKATHREQVHQTLVEACKRDRAKINILPMSSLGLVEMTRQRLRDSLYQTATESCGCCGGLGAVLTPLTLAHDIMRQLAGEAREFPGSHLLVTAHPQIASILQQEGERLINRLAAEFQVKITISQQALFPREYFEIQREWGDKE